MLDKLQAVYGRYEELCAKSEQPDFYSDPQKAAALLREKNELEPIVEAYLAYRRAEQDLLDAQELMADPEMRELCQETYKEAKESMEQLRDQLRILLLPKDPNDDKNVIVEIRGGVGGEEAALFAADLFRMYSMYAERKRFSIEVMNENATELGGYKIENMNDLTRALRNFEAGQTASITVWRGGTELVLTIVFAEKLPS